MQEMRAKVVWLAAAATLVVAAMALAGAADETEVVYLSGHGKDDPVQWEFFCTAGRRSGEWTTLGVPSNWELQGFGGYNYGHDKDKANEQGKYRRTFTVPENWGEKRIFIVFEGVMTDTEAWVNGKSAGPKHQGGFYRFKYEITDLVKPGENLLEVTVSKVSSDPSVEAAEREADYWVFGGIYRPVYLEVVPRQFIERTAIDARADGAFVLEVHLDGSGAADSVVAEIIELDGASLGKPFEAKVEGGAEKVVLRTHVAGHKTWTAETPNLYSVRATLRQGERAVHSVTERFGFRTFEVRPGDGLYLNGRKIRLKGVCRHSFWPDSGRCLSTQISYDDVRLIREMNMNAVRMSHYPPDEHFLEACDELGLYVLDELAGWQKPPYSTDIGKKLVKEMVTRDVSHPCILFWDNGNEGGWNRELDDEFALYDPQKRTVLHPWENFNGLDTAHYQNYDSTRKKLRGSTLVLPTEFMHGLYDGGLGAGLYDYWNLMRASPLGAGGFLWALVDEGVVRTDQGGQIDVDGNHAPDGIVGPYRQKEGSFYAVREIWSPIRVLFEELPADFDGMVWVENRYDFTNLQDCTFEAKLANFPAPHEQANGHATFFRRAFQGPDVQPHGEAMLPLGLPSNWQDADALYLTAYDPQQREIWTWSWDLRDRAHYYDEHIRNAAAETKQLKIGQTDTELSIRADDLTVLFSMQTGKLTRVLKAEREIGFGGPRLIGSEDRPGQVRIMQSPDDNSIQVDVTQDGELRRTSWTVYLNGWILLDYEYQLEGNFDLVGIDFRCPESEMRAMRFLGRGPHRVWKNRLKGGTLDVWSNKYKNHVPGATWDFPEFKGYYRDWRWVVFSTKQGDITVVNGTPELFLGVYRPEDGPLPAKTKLDVPNTGIAFLHGIPAIGTKFKEPEQLGPESRQNHASGTYRGAVWLRFGK